MPALKKMKFLTNLKVPWGPKSNKKRKHEEEGNQEKENVSSVAFCNASIKL
jgi:hypothetical protein